MRSLLCFAVIAVLSGCDAAAPRPGNNPTGDVAVLPLPVLATPHVTMIADPPPPFVYWAPENSTVKNHPHQKGIWIADAPDGTRKYYFGDQCRASEYQGFVGRPSQELPEEPEKANWRLKCSTCPVTSDLRPDRLNVSYDEKTKLIDDISCG